MFSLTKFRNDYDPSQTEVVINGRSYPLFMPKSIDQFIDPQDTLNSFPLWAKVWDASVVLADLLARMKVVPSKKFLEIGAGIGLAGVVAAARGHQITVTDYNSDALKFAEANAELNQCSTMTVLKLNWHQPQLGRIYDYIVGADVVYKEQDIQPMHRLFRKVLKSSGKIILVEQMRGTVLKFHKAMADNYRIIVEKKTLRSDQEKIRLAVFHMIPKAN